MVFVPVSPLKTGRDPIINFLSLLGYPFPAKL